MVTVSHLTGDVPPMQGLNGLQLGVTKYLLTNWGDPPSNPQLHKPKATLGNSSGWMSRDLSHQKKTRILSIESWLIDRDPYS